MPRSASSRAGRASSSTKPTSKRPASCRPEAASCYRLPVEDLRGNRRLSAWAVKQLKPGQRIERDTRRASRDTSALDRAEKISEPARSSCGSCPSQSVFSARRFPSAAASRLMRDDALPWGGHRRCSASLSHEFHRARPDCSAAGCALGIAAQTAWPTGLGNIVDGRIAPPGALPAAYGMLTGLALLLGFALPPLAALGRVPTLRVLRRDLVHLGPLEPSPMWQVRGDRAHDPVEGGGTEALAPMVVGGFAAPWLSQAC